MNFLKIWITNMYLFDTNLHLAYLLKDYETDPTTLRYTAKMTTVNYHDIVTTVVILGEIDLVVNTTIFKKYQIPEANRLTLKQALKQYIQNLKDKALLLEPTKETYYQALENYQNTTNNLSLNDWFILETARTNNIKLITLDQNLRSEAQRQNIPIELF